MELTAGNNGLTLNLCVMYSGRSEVIDAAKRMAEAAVKGEFDLSRLDEQHFKQFFYHPDNTVFIDDLVIRAGDGRGLQGITFESVLAGCEEKLTATEPPCRWWRQGNSGGPLGNAFPVRHKLHLEHSAFPEDIA